MKSKEIICKKYDVELLKKEYPLFEIKYEYLQKKYKKMNMNTKEVMHELDISNATFYARKKAGIRLPDYCQEQEKSRIYFPIISVATFLSKNLILVNWAKRNGNLVSFLKYFKEEYFEDEISHQIANVITDYISIFL